MVRKKWNWSMFFFGGGEVGHGDDIVKLYVEVAYLLDRRTSRSADVRGCDVCLRPEGRGICGSAGAG